MTQQDKANEVLCGCADPETYERPYQLDLEYQLAQSYHWSGSFVKDYLFFICNWHPFIGMLCSHPFHPWSKSERVQSFIVSCSITLLPAALLVRRLHQNGFSDTETSGTVFFTITLPMMVIEASLYWLAVGGIFCRGGVCHCVTHIVDFIRACCLGFSLIVSTFAILLSLLTLGNADPMKLIRPLVMSRMQSYVIWFPLWFLLPCVGFLQVWSRERRALEGQGEIRP